MVILLIVQYLGSICGFESRWCWFWNIPALSKKFNFCQNLPKKFNIYRNIFNMSVGNFVRHPDLEFLLHPFRVSNFSINFIYSVVIYFSNQISCLCVSRSRIFCRFRSKLNLASLKLLQKKNCLAISLFISLLLINGSNYDLKNVWKTSTCRVKFLKKQKPSSDKKLWKQDL